MANNLFCSTQKASSKEYRDNFDKIFCKRFPKGEEDLLEKPVCVDWMKLINPKIIYGSVKISGPVTPFSDFLLKQQDEFDRDNVAFIKTHLKELFTEKQHGRSNQDIPYPEETREREIERRLKESGK